jgi:hypothetical protein
VSVTPSECAGFPLGLHPFQMPPGSTDRVEQGGKIDGAAGEVMPRERLNGPPVYTGWASASGYRPGNIEALTGFLARGADSARFPALPTEQPHDSPMLRNRRVVKGKVGIFKKKVVKTLRQTCRAAGTPSARGHRNRDETDGLHGHRREHRR